MSQELEITKEGKYIYGIIRNSDDIDWGTIGIGDRHDRVSGVIYRDICAVVSSSPIIQYEARRANMIAHQKVLEKVHPMVLSKLVGHSSLNTTMQYYQPTREDLRKATEKQ